MTSNLLSNNYIFTQCLDTDTRNADILACIHFPAYRKLAISRGFIFAFFNIVASMWQYEIYFQDVHIFADI